MIWFTGLSGSGKSTLATLLAAELRARGVVVEVLDGDEVRTHLSKGLGFSREDRDTNVRRIGFVAKLLARAGACAMTAAISPYRDVRDEQRRNIGRFVEVYCKCSLDELTARDPKGLYEKARRGEIAFFSGVTDPYEEPLAPDVVVDTGRSSKQACVAQLLAHLEQAGYLSAVAAQLLGPPYGQKATATRAAAKPASETIELLPEAWVKAELLATGLLAPVRGPLAQGDATKVDKERRLESGLAWPLPFQVELPALARGAVVGDTLRLVGKAALDLVIESTWVGDGGQCFVAGEIVGQAPPLVERVRAGILAAGLSRAAGFVLRGAVDAERELLLSLALESAGGVVVLASEPAAVASAQSFAARRALADRCLVVPVASVPVLSADDDPLLQVIIVRNAGLRRVLLDAPHGTQARPPRAALGADAERELGIEIVAAGPVLEVEPGKLGTARMRGSGS